jgi:hypothetical protein
MRLLPGRLAGAAGRTGTLRTDLRLCQTQRARIGVRSNVALAGTLAASDDAHVRFGAFLITALFVLTACGSDSTGSGAAGGDSIAQTDCQVRFAMTEGALTSEFQAIFDYGRASGHFAGVNIGAECARLDSRAAVYGSNQCTGREGACRDRDRPEMYVVAQATQPLPAPLELLECRFVASKVPVIEDFALVDVFATDADGAIVEPPPTIAVTRIECETPETTTTTLPEPDPCDEVSCPDGEYCFDGDCARTGRYRIELQTDVAASYAALQIDVIYDCSSGRFDGLGDEVACRPAPEINAYAAFNHSGCLAGGDQATVAAGMISLLGWPGPGPLFSCDYASATGEPPTAESFRISVVDAWTIDDKPIQNATVSVSAARPIAP